MGRLTESEAKDCIQGKLDCMNKCDVFDCKGTDECDSCNYCYSQGTFGEQKEAYEMAIKALEKQLAKKALEINENLVKVESLGVSSAKADSIELLIAFGVIAVVLFVYMWLRYTYKEGVVLASSIVLTGILSLALMLITRMELSLVSLGVVVMMSVLSGVLVMTTIFLNTVISKANILKMQMI